MGLIDLLRHNITQTGARAPDTLSQAKRGRSTSVLGRSTLYQFKKDVLSIVAQLNHGVRHDDCETLKRQMIFVQTQLFHSLYHDPGISAEAKEALMHYHLKSVKSTIDDRRHGRLREIGASAPAPR
ncbi:hypothetical protein [Pseudothauera lacus]|uniref:hypothetical protein n=1 Tax=Pseudothauera lacus TaxID=2136175 RepID=UPI001F2834A6|nr:hypothetical protein [Pseudothauera lacus]